MLTLMDVLKNNLSYVPGKTVKFYSPDADKDFIGEIEKVELTLDTISLSVHYYINVPEGPEVGKYHGQHIVTDDCIIELK